MCAQSAVIAFVVEKTLTMVSRSHGRVRAASAWPPQRSTTIRPSTVAANDAPTSRPSSKLAANASRTAAKRGSHSPWIMASLAEKLDDDPLLPPPVELRIEHLLPWTEVERPLGDREDHLVMDERALEMRVGIVLTGLVMAIVPRRSELLEPLHEIVLQAALLVVHPDPGGDVHGGDEAESLLHARRRDDVGDAIGDVHQLVALAGVEPEIVGVGMHPCTGSGRERDVEEQDLRWLGSDQGHRILPRHRGAVAGAQRRLVEPRGAARHLHPDAAPVPERLHDAGARRQPRRADGDVLEHLDGPGTGRGAGDLVHRAAIERHRLLVVPWRQPAALGNDPDLQEVHRLDPRRVELAVLDAGPGTHDLHLAGMDHGAGPEAV